MGMGRIAVAMSGGVDSSTAAAILKEAGSVAHPEKKTERATKNMALIHKGILFIQTSSFLIAMYGV